MSAILKFDFQKREQFRFSEKKLSKLHKKDPILHVATIFSLKQGETRTSHGPIPHPLMSKVRPIFETLVQRLNMSKNYIFSSQN